MSEYLGPSASPPPRSELLLIALGVVLTVVGIILIWVAPATIWPLVAAIPAGGCVGAGLYKQGTRYNRLDRDWRAVDQEWHRGR